MHQYHLILASILLVTTGLSQASRLGPAQERVQAGEAEQDLVRVHESSVPFNLSGAKANEIAPESQVVGISFEAAGLNISPDRLAAVGNRTKQSQEFEVHQQPSTTTTSGPAQPEAITIVVISEPVTSGSTEALSSSPWPSSTASSQETGWPMTQPPAGDEPVGSRTVRSGEAVLCGEANPLGKSNKRLALDRIVGGHKTEPGEFPFQVRLNIRSRRGSGICGGVVLDNRHILTAAHCMAACASQHLTTATIESSSVKATVGDHSIRANDGELELDVERITPHEKYEACNFYANDHDIALVKTSQPIEYRFTSDGYGSINRPCMPNSSDVVYKEGEQVLVSGWGVTRENSGALSNILRYVQVPIVNLTKCQETYGSRVTNDHVCAGFQAGGKDSCQGDSGGPLVRVVENRYELVGIVSFGYGCGQPSAPGVYTRVASYVDWIKANL